MRSIELSAFPITPADAGGRVDTAALRRLVARLCAAGVHSIGLLGSTGSYPYLSRGERRRALDAALDAAGDRAPIMVGVGALRTGEAVALAQDAKAAGAVAGLLAPVSYTPLTDDEVFAHFEAVAAQSLLPICIYDNPATTHFRFGAPLVARLSRLPGIVAIKSPAAGPEAVADQLAELRGLLPAGFSVGCSGDWNAAEALLAGSDVWYSVIGGILPDAALAIVRAAEAEDAAEVRRLDAAMAPLWTLFKELSSLRVVYAIAELLGLCRAAPPRPILPLAPPLVRKVEDVLAALEPRPRNV